MRQKTTLERLIEITSKFRFRYSLVVLLLLSYILITLYPPFMVVSDRDFRLIDEGAKVIGHLLSAAAGYFFRSQTTNGVKK